MASQNLLSHHVEMYRFMQLLICGVMHVACKRIGESAELKVVSQRLSLRNLRQDPPALVVDQRATIGFRLHLVWSTVQCLREERIRNRSSVA
jgi:hypothetical protein